jgi:chromosomal replication initiation ATPase DnaA
MYNPLYLYGGEGVGKTHLLMAVGLKASQSDPPRSIEYVTPDRMAEAFSAAASAGQADAFRHRLAEADVLLIDDAHLLDRRRDVQTELAKLIQQAQSSGRHLLLAGRCAPRDIDNFDSSLASLIDAGLVVEMGAPDYETRLGVLQGRASARATGLDESVLSVVAEFDITNTRELVSLLNRLIALDAVSESPLTPEGARSLLEGEALAIDASPRPSLITARHQASEDEFADFLSEVSVTVQQQVTAWEAELTEAIRRWGRKGIDTARLEGLLDQGTPIPVEAALEEFERDAERLVTLRKSVSEVDPVRADDPLFRDPDRVSEAQVLADTLAPQTESLPGPSPAWTFNNYIGSAVNRRTDEAMRGLEDQGSRNVIIVIGRTGVGKTHLLHATGNALTSALGSGVTCVSAREFRDMTAEAERDDRVSELRSLFQSSKALLIDDVQLLAGTESAQQELAGLVDTLLGEGKPLVLTSNAPPDELAGLSEQLMSRIRGADSFVLLSPDREFRSSMVQRMMGGVAAEADPELVDYLADRPADSVRAVTGLVQRVLDAADARAAPPSAGLARELIEGALPRARRSSAGLRTSGVVVSPAGALQSREKMIWNWPDPAERLVEELT